MPGDDQRSAASAGLPDGLHGRHARGDAMTYPVFDVLVVGAGPAGLAAAAMAGRAGGRVGLLDDNPAPGGQIWRSATAGPAGRWIRAARRNDAILLTGTRVIVPLGPGVL